MEKLKLKYQDARRALETLEAILREPYSAIVRDASIQRFEYTFEAIWKFIKEYLQEKEGIVAASPKACFREIFQLGVISEEQTVKLLEMTDHRNMTAHTYHEEVAQKIYGALTVYRDLLGLLLAKFDGKFK